MVMSIRAIEVGMRMGMMMVIGDIMRVITVRVLVIRVSVFQRRRFFARFLFDPPTRLG
jgi:hypothetical protein